MTENPILYRKHHDTELTDLLFFLSWHQTTKQRVFCYWAWKL